MLFDYYEDNCTICGGTGYLVKHIGDKNDYRSCWVCNGTGVGRYFPSLPETPSEIAHRRIKKAKELWAEEAI